MAMAMNGINYGNYGLGSKKYNEFKSPPPAGKTPEAKNAKEPEEQKTGIYTQNPYDKAESAFMKANGLDADLVRQGRIMERMTLSGKGAFYDYENHTTVGIPDKDTPSLYRLVSVDSEEGKAEIAKRIAERDQAAAEYAKYKELKGSAGEKHKVEIYKPVYDYSRAEKKERAFASANGIDYDLAMKGKMYESFEKQNGRFQLFSPENRDDYEQAIAEWSKYKELKTSDSGATKPNSSHPVKENHHSSFNKGKYHLSGSEMDKLREVRSGMKGNISAFKQMVHAHAKAQAQYSGKAGGSSTLKDMLKGVTPEQAQSAISADGEWGVNKTAERLLNFAIALSGGDPSKISVLRDAVQKGFNAAAKVWGGALPGICYDTLQKVMEGFDAWEKSGNAQSALSLTT